jgi:hypothetical protein
MDRGLDFADATLIFDGVTFEVEDLRKDYGEIESDLLRNLRRSNDCDGLHPTWL